MTGPELSIVMPVFKEGEAVEPAIRALVEQVRTPHELLVVYDFDEDPTVPVIARLAAEMPAVRGLRNDLGRGVLNAMKAGIAGSSGTVRPHLDGRRLGRAAPRRRDGRPGARRGRHRGRVAVHAGRSPGRRPVR